MANTAKWVAGASPLSAPASVLTTELNTLASNTASAASAAIDNQANLDRWCDLILHLANITPSAGAYVTIYILVSYDGGTTYPSATGSVLRNQPSHILCVIPLDTAAAAQDIVVRQLALPPQKFKLVLDNQAGVSFAGSGNTLKIETYNENLNG